SGGGDRGPQRERERQHVTVVVVGVLSDEVHPPRRVPDAVRAAVLPLKRRRGARAGGGLALNPAGACLSPHWTPPLGGGVRPPPARCRRRKPPSRTPRQPGT